MTFLKRAHWNECGGRITLCNKTGVGAVILLRLMFRCSAVCISTELPCMNIFLTNPYSIPTSEKLWRAGSSVMWLLRKSGSVLCILSPACHVLYYVEPRIGYHVLFSDMGTVLWNQSQVEEQVLNTKHPFLSFNCCFSVHFDKYKTIFANKCTVY